MILAGNPFEFSAAGFESLAAKFDPTDDRFVGNLVPGELDGGGDRFVGGSDQSAVAGREAHQHAEAAFGYLDATSGAEGAAAATVAGAGAVDHEAAEGVLNFFFEAEVLFASLGFFFGLAAASASGIEGVDATPGIEGGITGGNLGVEIAVGEVEIPVGVFDVADEIADGGLEIGKLDVGVHAGDEHAAVDAGRESRTGDTVVPHAATLQQRVANLGFEVNVPSTGKLVAGCVVCVILDVVSEGEFRTGHGALGEL